MIHIERRWVPISALEHWIYCPRQCALIHVEQSFDENLFTIRGSRFHTRVTSGITTIDGDTVTRRDLPLWSDALGIRGRADVVEFRDGSPYPIEYKSGGRHGRAADVQVCAQAMCLEEMLDVDIDRGSIYFGKQRRRKVVEFDTGLRSLVERTIREVRDAFIASCLPEAPNDSRCNRCSLVDTCLPGIVGDQQRIARLNDLLWVTSDA